MVLAFMAQHVWEVGAGVLAVLIGGQGLLWLIRGSSTPQALGMSEQSARTIGSVAVVIGVVVGVAAFTVHAEQPGARSGNGWGGTTGIVVLCIWVALMCAGPVMKLMRYKPSARRGEQPRLDKP